MTKAIFVLLLLTTRVTFADECSDRFPGGAPDYTFVQKTRLDILGEIRKDTLIYGIAAEKIWHPHFDAGVKINYIALPRDGQSIEALVDARVYPLFIVGGIGTNGVCGMKPRDWHQGAPYLNLALGGRATTAFSNGAVLFGAALGWEYGLGNRVALFAEAGRTFAIGSFDQWGLRVGVRF
jgi:hypothetical protein